ncbi:Vesicle-associated membrane protein 2 [Frankliniella fusca]|uniref:Vesicle-associated membrane protein 2 n=1 Tax=Frankliniella fusca TaxID=407009 RepID=A0AAE1LMK1_9NEOP|nr:Vesicle-associated membrane protein 2 [Frankliniella fusca]
MDRSGGFSGNSGASGPPGSQLGNSQKKLQQTQAQVDEVVGIMRVNVEKVLERDMKLSELDDRAGETHGSFCMSASGSSWVVDIMRENIDRVLERDEKLTELDSRADALRMGASAFEQQAARLKRKFWWQNIKMMIIMGVIGVVLLAIIIIWIASSVGSDSPSTPAVTPNP